jgi:parvulin-like peptidyl-prolyl isomerase
VKLFPRVLLATALVSSLSFAGLVNGVAIIINKEPITLYEIYKYAEHFKMSKKDALDLLVRQKLEDAEIKNMDIRVDMFEVDNYIRSMAQQNGVSEFDFLKMVKAQNIEIEAYKEDLKTKLKRDKLYQQIIREKAQPVTDEAMEDFYNDNKAEFEVAKSFDVVAYTAASEDELKAISKNPMLRPANTNIQEQSLESEKLNPNIQSLLTQTKTGEFSPTLKMENGYVMFFVKAKNDISLVPFESAKKTIYNVLYQKAEQKALSDYFEKLKSSANIEVLRNPN